MKAETLERSNILILSRGGGGGGGGGGHSGTEGGRTRVTYFAEDLRMSAILLKKSTFLYPGTKYGG